MPCKALREDRLDHLEGLLAKLIELTEESQALFVSKEKLAKRINLSVRTIEEAMAAEGDDKMPHHKFGTRVLFDPEEVKAWIKDRKAVGKGVTVSVKDKFRKAPTLDELRLRKSKRVATSKNA